MQPSYHGNDKSSLSRRPCTTLVIAARAVATKAVVVLTIMNATSTMAAPDSREVLERALIAWRMRELCLALSGAAYSVYEQQPDGPPELQGAARFYLALTRIEEENPKAAATLLATKPKNWSPPPELLVKWEAWREALEQHSLATASSARAGKASPTPLAARIHSALYRQATSVSLAEAATDEDVLDAARAAFGGGDSGKFAELAGRVPYTPRLVVRCKSNAKDTLEYAFFDPAIWTICLGTRVVEIRQLVVQGNLEQSARDLLTGWADAFEGKYESTWAQANVVLPALREQRSDSRATALAMEWYALAEFAGRRAGRPAEDIAAIAPADELSERVTSRALRASSLSFDRAIPWLLRAEATVRHEISGDTPLSDAVLRSRAPDRIARANALLDIYWEIAWCYRCRHLAAGNLTLPLGELPRSDAIRSNSIVRTLRSPLVLAPTAQLSLLQVIITADTSSRIGDFESWQDLLQPELMEQEPSLSIALALARLLSAEARVRGGKTAHSPTDVFAPEPVEEMLVGITFESPPRPRPEPIPQPSGRWFYGLIVLGIAALAYFGYRKSRSK